MLEGCIQRRLADRAGVIDDTALVDALGRQSGIIGKLDHANPIALEALGKRLVAAVHEADHAVAEAQVDLQVQLHAPGIARVRVEAVYDHRAGRGRHRAGITFA